MATFDNRESLASVRTKINAAISFVDSFARDPASLDPFPTVASLTADTTLTYTAGQAKSVATGDIINAGGFRYEVAASNASDHHVTTAGGVKLYVLPEADGWYSAAAFDPADDGVTDATTVLQKIRDAAGAYGKIRVADGTYKLTNFAMNVEGQHWWFGDGAEVNSSSGTTADAIDITADNVKVQGGKFDNLLTPGAYADFACIRINGADGVEIFGARIGAARGPCVYAIDCSNIIIRDNQFFDTWYAAIFLKPSSADYGTVSITGNHILNTNASGGYDYGINVHNDNDAVLGVQRVVIANNIVVFPTSSAQLPIGIEVYGGDAVLGEALGTEGTAGVVAVTGNAVSGAGIGISLSQTVDATIAGNTVKNSFLYGIESVNPYSVTITGNAVNGAQTGISVSGSGDGIAVSGNAVRGTTSNGIQLSQVGQKASVFGNNITVTSGRGIRVLSTSLSSISGNILDGNGTGTKAILLDKSDRCAVNGNVGDNWTENGVQLFADDAVAYNYIVASGNVWKSTPNSLALATQLSGGASIGRFVEYVHNLSDNDAFYSYDIHNTLNNVREIIGAGSPEGVFTAGIGSRYLRTDGGASTTLYIKESGTGNTGWVAK